MFVFLDIDGVMVPAKSWEKPKLLNDGFPEFSKNAVQVLQKVITEDTTIILTSSHRSRFNLEEWKNIFELRGIEVNRLSILEKSSFGTSRKDELMKWFNLNTIHEDFIIIDDDKSLNDLPDYLKMNLILTDSILGLTENHLEAFDAILKKQKHII